MENRATLSTTWRSHQTPPKSPSDSPTTSSLSTELERIGNVLGLVSSPIFNHDMSMHANRFLSAFLSSHRGDKKAICNKFVQTVSKHK